MLNVMWSPPEEGIMLLIKLRRSFSYIYLKSGDGWDLFDEIPDLIAEFFQVQGHEVEIVNSWQLLPLNLTPGVSQ